MLDTPVSPHKPAAAAAAPLSYDDLSALAWVSGELRRSLEAAHKALRRHLKDTEAVGVSGKGDLDALDLAVLRTAKNQIHQGVGALELVGLPAAAEALRSAELLVQRMVAKPAHATRAAVVAVEKVSFGLLDLLGRQLAGKPLSPVLLFPQVQAALQLAGSDRIHPADLWRINWQWLTPPADLAAKPRKCDEAARGEMEQLVLALMREPGRAAYTGMAELCAALGAGAARMLEQQNLASLWQLAAAVFEALALGLLTNDVHTKRLGSRLLAQLRMACKGQVQASDRLAQDLLFFCSHASAPALAGLAPKAAPRLSAVRQAWQLDQLPTGDYNTTRLGLFDPAQVSLARRRVAAAKDTWSAVAGDEQHRITSLNEQFSLVGDSLQKLFPQGDALATSLAQAAQQAVSTNAAPEPSLAMEVATAMLYVDAALEDGEFDQPELPARVQHLAQRIDAVRAGGSPQPLALWMEDLYRRVSDRQTMGSVVQELRASLSVIEKQIDAYFRQPGDRSVLIPVPAQLSSMRGVFSVLGLSHASQAVLHMRDEVDALAQTEIDTQRAIQAGTFDRLADNLGALSFLIDMLSVQPKLAKSLFRFDADSGSLSAVMGQAERVSAFGGLDDLSSAPTLPAALPVERTTPALSSPAPTSAPATLLAGIEALASSAERTDVSDTQVLRQLESLAPQAVAADQNELARLLGHAQNELSDSASPAASRSLRSELAQAVTGLSTQSGYMPDPTPPRAPVPAPRAAPAGGTGLEDDPEMRDIFIDEARDVVADATTALESLAGLANPGVLGTGAAPGTAPSGTAEMTVIRRAFHTLKGSARMVGLREFGEAAWACEQLYNARLAQTGGVDGPMQQFTAEALAYLGGWTEAIAHADGMLGSYNAADVATSADALRVQGVLLPIAPLGALHGGAQSAPVLAPPAAPLVDLPFDVPVDLPFNVPVDLPFNVPVDLPLDLSQAPAAGLAATLASSAAALAGFAGFAGVAAAAAAGEKKPDSVASHEATMPLGLHGFESPTLPAVFSAQAGATELQQRVPGLPQATDLDLSGNLPDTLPSTTSTQTPALSTGATPGVGDFVFEWDESRPQLPADLADSPPRDAETSDTPDTPATTSTALLGLMPARPPRAAALVHEPVPVPVPPAASLGLPQAEAVELDFDEIGALFASEEPVEILAEPAVVDPSQDAATDLSLLSLLANADPQTLTPATPALIAGLGVLATDDDEALLSAPQPLPQPEEEPFKAVGPLRISIPLFNIFLNEADELSRHLVTQMAEWTLEQDTQPVPDSSVALAHSLAGNAATVGATGLSALARSLEHALMRSHAVGVGRPDEATLFSDAAEEIRRLLHQFAAGFLREVPPELTARLIDHEHWPVPLPDTGGLSSGHVPLLDSRAAPLQVHQAHQAEAGAGVVDHIDPELFPIFEEEAEELLPELQARLQDWLDAPSDAAKPAACMRSLHTFKGGARLAGALRLGDMAHRLEATIETLAAHNNLGVSDVEPLLARGDAMVATFEALCKAAATAPALVVTPVIGPATAPVIAPVTAPVTAPVIAPVTTPVIAQVIAPGRAPVSQPVLAAPTGDLDIDLGVAFEAAPAVTPSNTVPDSAVPAAVAALAAAAAAAWASSNPTAAAAAPAALPGVERAVEPAIAPAVAPVPDPATQPASGPVVAPVAPVAPPTTINWARFSALPLPAAADADDAATDPGLVPTHNAVVRVRAALLDRLVNQAGEVSITRSRIAADVKQLQGTLGDLHDSLDRMRTQLRDLELQAETQMSSRLEAAKAASQGFDPLEMDRFTRFQELTRFMAESVNDVATLQRSLQRTLQTTEDELAAQTRLTRELQEDLLRTRMVEFDSTTERLARTVRQAAKDSGKQARLELVGGGIEVDRGVLERMIGPFEHLLRNCVAHGIEAPAERQRLGKDSTGSVTVTVTQSGNEVMVEFADDGAGLDLARIKQRALQRGLLAADADAAQTTDAALAQLIFQPGFSTADTITTLAGRGVGLDVVKSDVMAMGGRVQTHSTPGQGTRITLLLPLTTAVTQVVMLRCGDTQVAVPSTLIEVVRRVPSTEVLASYTSGEQQFGDSTLPFFWLTALLRSGSRGPTDGKSQTVVVVRSAAQRVAVHVDEVMGNQEVVVKNVGPQLARVPGLAGVTLLASGAVAYIYNPVALANVFGVQARALMQLGEPVAVAAAVPAAGAAAGMAATAVISSAPLVMVVDDSITVRRVTQRLLVREGYRVVTAKDGMDALERLGQLQPQRPVVMLSDIEMPRMDGFDLLRHVRADANLASLPVVMITSRSAQKHRDHATQLGADHYLGKPYAEDELLALVARYARGEQRAAAPGVTTH